MRKALYAFSDSPGCRSQEGSFGCVSLKIDMEAFSRLYLECPAGNSNLKQPSFWGRFGASLDRMVRSDLAPTTSKNSLRPRPRSRSGTQFVFELRSQVNTHSSRSDADMVTCQVSCRILRWSRTKS